MAQVLDKQGLQHYANKMCNADNRKVGSKNLPTALNEIDIAIDGFKTLFETEYGTPVNMELENNENVFSIGTGININKKDDVENSFTDVELSGNSLVNLFTTTQNFASSGNNIVRNGFVITLSNTSEWTKIGNRLNLKPNTTYYAQVTCENKSNNICSSYVRLSHDINYQAGINVAIFPANSITTQNTVFTTDDTGLVLLSVERGQGTNECIFYDIILLEGDWTNKPIPQYFEGLKSIGEKEDGNHKISISSVGKNLCPYNNAEFQAIETKPWVDMLGVTGIHGGSTVANKTQTWFYLSEGRYKISYKIENCIIQIIDKDENILNLNNYFNGGYVCVRLKSTSTSGTYSIKDLQIELSETQTHYEPYKEDKKEISLNEPLRGLPNEIKDTIEKINGEWKIVRKVGSIVLNGSEQWKEQVNGSTEEFLDIRCGYSTLLNRNRQNGLCDKFNYITKGSPIGEQEGIQLYTHATQSQFIASMSKSRFSTVDSFKEYLAQNHTTVLYELVTPIIEDISPITLQCWKNGTISIDEVLPVESTHTVALNKSAQIQKNIEELSILKNRIEALEKQYNNSTLNQAYELELLRLDMQLDNII